MDTASNDTATAGDVTASAGDVTASAGDVTDTRGALPAPPTVLSRRDRQRVALEPGQLTPTWAITFWVVWLLIGGSLGAVWYSSRITGLATWWLGPETNPRWWFHLVPFVAPFALCVLSIRFTRHLPWFGIGGALLTGLVAVGDLWTVPGFAAIEFALAGAGLAASLAAFTGVLQPADG